jgi:hypothetical protein
MESLNKYEINDFVSGGGISIELLLRRTLVRPAVLFFFFFNVGTCLFAQRQNISLNDNWLTIATNNDKVLPVNTYQTVIAV